MNASTQDKETGLTAGVNKRAASMAAKGRTIEGRPDLWPQYVPASESPEEKTILDEYIAQMTIFEKVAQMIIADISQVQPEELSEIPLGAILNGGDTSPYGERHALPETWLALADKYWLASSTRDGSKVPVLWGTDAVHGHNNLYGAILFPHNIGLGAARDPDLITRIAKATAEDVRITGQDWIFAPTLAVAQDPRWGRFYESYSSDPDLIALYAASFVKGLQSPLGDIYTLATAKHFVGDGGTQGGVDQGNTACTEDILVRQHGLVYLPAIREGVATIMASYSSWFGEKLHDSQYLLTDILKDRLGFDGFVVGDWNGHEQVAGCSQDNAARVINAGVDMIMAPEAWRALHTNTVKQIEIGDISIERINDATRRILRVKLRSGLLHAPRPSARYLAGETTRLQSEDRRALAHEAVQKSLVLLKGDPDTFTSSAHGRFLICGDAATHINRQLGGWSLTWRGNGTTNEDFPHSCTIATGLQGKIEANGGVCDIIGDEKFEPSHNDAKYDAAFVIIGEEPYAEWFGDREDLRFHSNSFKLMQQLKAQGIPIITVFLSGRPLAVCELIDISDVFVAAWLPGTEGEAVADMFFKDGGRVKFTGKLPFDWPSNDGGIRWPIGHQAELTDSKTGVFDE